MAELIRKSAVEIVILLRAGEISIADTLDALETRIAEVDGDINALPTLCFERAREHAAARDYRAAPLGGIPVAIKDLEDVAGVRTTYGSSVSSDHVPHESDLLVQTIESNGGIVYAKSNTPEFGSGANTFNDVFGATCNPFDHALSAGGSSGGAAAALASGTAWLAQGSDLGGSLRTPASFCGVTSLRPSPGLIASSPGQKPFEVYAQKGPMARNVADLALFTDAMTGSNSLAGLCKPRSGDGFGAAVAEPLKPQRVAVSRDLGIADTSDEVGALFDVAIGKLQRDNIDIDHEHPDLAASHRAFDVSRALGYALAYGSDLDRIRAQIKPENVWNIEQGLALSTPQIIDAMAAQGEVFNNAAGFMRNYDLLICPASIITPYPLEERYPGFSDGLEYSEYYRWLALVYAVTMTTLPVITIPSGQNDAGLPIGIQLIGKPHGEQALFACASYLEQLFDWNPPPLL